MRKEELCDALGDINENYVKEARSANGAKRHRWMKRGVIAAAAALCLFAGGLGVLTPFGGMAVTAYAQGTDQEITAAGAVITTGTISDTGEMRGHLLMFYLAGKDIATVRFSCKNQWIDFRDWTEQRDEYGRARNFTVSYGADASEYYYLLIDWVPERTIRALTDDPDSTIATLPEELREDVIVMEITFANGKTATKAITVSLLDDGTFFATLDDYTIREEDAFVRRPDSEAIPREILYAEGDGAV